MTISVTPIATSGQVNSYTQMASLMAALKGSNDKLPKTGSITETLGTIQGNLSLLPPVTIYTDHGKLASNKGSGKLLGYA